MTFPLRAYANGCQKNKSMNIIESRLNGVYIFELHVYRDARGYFTETFREAILQEALQQPIRFVQDNESVSKKASLEACTINCRLWPKVNWYVL